MTNQLSRQQVILKVQDVTGGDYIEVAKMIHEADSVTVILRALEAAHRNGMRTAARLLASDANAILEQVNAAADLERSLIN